MFMSNLSIKDKRHTVLCKCFSTLLVKYLNVDPREQQEAYVDMSVFDKLTCISWTINVDARRYFINHLLLKCSSLFG